MRNASDWLPWLSLGALTALWLARWAMFPLVLDPSYHLFVGQQVADAGGPLAYEWWENAPAGRPHLYPPVFHLLLAALLKMGGSPVVVIRLASVALLPALLLSLFLVIRRLVGPSAALASLWVGMIPFSFHLRSATTMAATLGMIELLWFILAVERERYLAAGLLLGLLCYTHLGLPWVALVMIAAYGCLQPAARPRAWKAIWGILLALPWWVHLWRYRAYLHLFSRQENAMVEMTPLLYGLAGVGVWRCWRLKEEYAWPLACWIGVTVLAPRHLYRWVSGEGLLPVLLLAGVGMDWLSSRLARRRPSARQDRGRTLTSLALFLVLIGSPTLERNASTWRWVWPDSAPWHLMGAPAAVRKAVDASGYSPQLDALARTVAGLSRPDEILWSNAPYAAGLVAALAHRPLASSMLSEVSAMGGADPIGAAHVIVWFKLGALPGMVPVAALSPYALTRVAEDELAVIFRQAAAHRTAHPPQAVLPLWTALALLGTAIGLILWDLRKARHPGPMSV